MKRRRILRIEEALEGGVQESEEDGETEDVWGFIRWVQNEGETHTGDKWRGKVSEEGGQESEESGEKGIGVGEWKRDAGKKIAVCGTAGLGEG